MSTLCHEEVFTFSRKPKTLLLYVLKEQHHCNERAIKLVYIWELVPDR